MSADRFTPGPWSVYSHPDLETYPFIVASADGGSICDASPGNLDITVEQAKANTRLIASAPTLVAALRELRDELEGAVTGGDEARGHDQWLQRLNDIATAAIVAATGATS